MEAGPRDTSKREANNYSTNMDRERDDPSRKGSRTVGAGIKALESISQQNVRNPGSKQREASASEYNTQGCRSGNPKKSKRGGTSESSFKSKPSEAVGACDLQESLAQLKGPFNQNASEESKQGTTSSVSNSAASGLRKEGDHKKVLKKKKSKMTVSAITSYKDADSAQMKQGGAKFKKAKQGGGPILTDRSNTQRDDLAAQGVTAKTGQTKTKSGSATSARNNAVLKLDRSRVSNINDTQQLQLSQNQALNLKSMEADQIMKATSKSRFSGFDQPMKSVSNWNESEPTESKKKTILSARSMSPTKALAGLGETSEIRKVFESQGSVHLESEEQDQQRRIGSDYEGTMQAANQPASPASKAPQIKNENGRQGPSMVLTESIVEIDGESQPSPQANNGSAQPTSAVTLTNPGSFGIRLHQLEVQSNLSLDMIEETKRGPPRQTLETQISPSKKESAVRSLLEATPTSFNALAEQNSPEAESDLIYRPELTEPLPILPKVTTSIHMPIKCPFENVRFIQLKRFQQFQQKQAELMSAGFELVGQRRKMIQLKTEDKIRKGPNGIEEQPAQAKIDDTTHFIKNIVFARDPKIIDQEKQHVHQRDAFQHLNILDLKQLVDRTKYLGEENKYVSLSPRAINRMRPLYQGSTQAKPVFDCQVYKLKDAEDRTLLFESRFESGNLYLSQKVSDQEYNLLMSNDINTQGHTQWFFFQVRNTRAGNRVRFNILNYSKPDSLFNYGMKVSVYSEKKSEKKLLGWHKDGDDIRYFMNGIRKDVTYYSKSYYTATFTYDFEYDDDVVYFAYSTPYTYSDLRNDITAIETDSERSKLVRKATLCRTLSGELCEVLTITSADNLENFSSRKGVVITARVHPGETVSSWMMRGVLTFLTDPKNFEARLLRENFVFKVVPMLNPDGVINGNYRCSLAGCDLNRRWKTPNKTLHPTIFHTKRLVKQIHSERGLVLYCDLHGHSRKQNVFMYGCNNKQNPGECRIFPYILSKINKYFSYEYSRFGVQKSKEATARVALYKELKNVPNVFTMESSFAGCDMGPAAGLHLTSEMLETLGHDVCRTILPFCNMHVPPELQEVPFFHNLVQQQAKKKADAQQIPGLKKKFKEPAIDIHSAFLGELNSNAELLNNAGGDDSSSGSDSAPSEDNLQAEELIKQLPTVDKTLKQQLKKNEIKRKAEEVQQAQSTVKLRRQSSGRNLKKEEPSKRQMSPLKRPVQVMEKKEEPKPEEKKKPKVETRDACTQTDRSDYQLIKQKMMRERKLQEEQQAAEQLSQQKRAQAAQSTEMSLINDLNSRPQNVIASNLGSTNNETGQRLQKMLAMAESKTRTGPQKMPLTQNYQNKPQQPPAQPSVTQAQGFGKAGLYQSGKAQQQQQQNPLMLPNATGGKGEVVEKNQYNFMGVSNFSAAQPSNSAQLKGGSQIESEYGTMTQNRPVMSQAKSGGKTAQLAATPNKGGQAEEFKSVYHVQGGSQRQRILENMTKQDTILNKGDSRKSGKRGISNGIGELPAMTTLSGHTNQSFKMSDSRHNQVFSHNNNSSGATSRIQSKQEGGGMGVAERPPNYETEPSTQRAPPMLSPQKQLASSSAKPQFSLPQTKLLAQKEFIILDGGSNKLVAGRKQGNRNLGKSTTNPPIGGTSMSNQQHYSNHSFAQGATSKIYSGSSVGADHAPEARFNAQRPPNISVAADQTLARNNSTHVTGGGKYAVPLGASPVNKAHRDQSLRVQKDSDQFQLKNNHMGDISYSQTMVTKVPAESKIMQDAGASQVQASEYAGSTSQPLRASINQHHQTPVKKPSSWQQNSAQIQNSAGQHYRAMGGQAIPTTNNPQNSHDDNCSKLPALNLRGPLKSGRTGPFNNAAGSNGPGLIGGLQIALNPGQGQLLTPQQKLNLPSSQMGKLKSNAVVQPQIIPINMQALSSYNQEFCEEGATLSTNANNGSSATQHKRNANGAALVMQGTLQNYSEQKMQVVPFSRQNGARTPSQQTEVKQIGAESELLQMKPNRGSFHLPDKTANNLGSFFMEGEQLHEFEVANVDLNRSRDMLLPGKPSAGSMVARLRNHSEITGDNRNGSQSTQDKYEYRSVIGSLEEAKLAMVAQGEADKTIFTPQVHSNKRNVAANNNSQGKVIGKRYSRN